MKRSISTARRPDGVLFRKCSGNRAFVRIVVKRPSLQADEVAEWLRRWTANPMCYARVGSNPILVEG